MPPQGSGAPPPGYGAPPPGYGAPPAGYGAPPQGYGGPAPGYGAPPHGYGAPPPGYGGQPPAVNPAVAQAQRPAGAAPLPGLDERPVFEGHAMHLASFAGYAKWSFITAALAGFGGWLGTLSWFAGWPLWLLGGIGLVGLAWVYLEHVTSKYKVTTRRIEFERGILSREVQSLELFRVIDVTYRQSLSDRMLGVGRIVLTSTDKTNPELHLYGLPGARPIFEQVRDAVQAARMLHSGRPMELVGGAGAPFEGEIVM